MGRPRIHNKGLPARVYLSHGSYFFRPRPGTIINLGRDFAQAMRAYGEAMQGAWSGQTLGDVVDRYRVEVLPRKAPKTAAEQGPQLDRLRAVFGRMHPDDITAQHCYLYADKRVGTKGKAGRKVPVLARHEVALLSHLLTSAIRWGIGTKNAALGLRFEKPAPRSRYITDAEFLAVRAMASAPVQVAMDLALLTGQRRGDILGLRREQLTDEGIVIRQGKTGRELTVSWSPDLRAVIARAKALPPQLPGVYMVRTRRGQRYSESGFSALWQRLMAKWVAQGGERFTFHDIRAKCASDKATLGGAAALLGHASSDTTKRVYRRGGETVEPLR